MRQQKNLNVCKLEEVLFYLSCFSHVLLIFLILQCLCSKVCSCPHKVFWNANLPGLFKMRPWGAGGLVFCANGLQWNDIQKSWNVPTKCQHHVKPNRMQQVNALKQDLSWSAYQGFVLPDRLAHGLESNPALINNLENNVTEETAFFRAPSRYDWCHCKIICENLEGHSYHFHWQVKRGKLQVCFASEWTNN